MQYGDRTVRVVAEASGQRAIIGSVGQRAIIESVGDDGRVFRSHVKWTNLLALTGQLF